jgi:hypothetical protein
VIIVATGVGGQPLGSVIAGASHILLKHTSPDAAQSIPVGIPFSRPAADSSGQPVPVLRKPIALPVHPPSRISSAIRSVVHSSVPGAETHDADSIPTVPSVERNTVNPPGMPMEEDPDVVYSMEDLEIPAFLRRRMHRPESETTGRAFHGAA